MTEFEFKDIVTQYLSGWRYGVGQLKVLRDRLQNMSQTAFETACQKLLAAHESSRRPTIATLIRMAHAEQEPEPARPFEPDLPYAEAKLSWHFYARYIAADINADRRGAIKDYYEARHGIGKPIFGKEDEGLRELLEKCEGAIQERAAACA